MEHADARSVLSPMCAAVGKADRDTLQTALTQPFQVACNAWQAAHAPSVSSGRVMRWVEGGGWQLRKEEAAG